MRDILTGLAIILIVVLTTLLVAPYFVDWNGQRGFLETQLSRAFGQKVTIGGSIDLKLLPTPYIRLNQAVIGGDEGALRIGIHHLDLELAVAPLLHGEFDVVEGRFDEPTIRLTLLPDRSLPPLPETPMLQADIRLERIAVHDGTLAVADPASGRTVVLDHLDFVAEAPSIVGPYKGSGTAGPAAQRTGFRFSTTDAKTGTTHLHLAFGETMTHPGVDLDGDLTLSGKDAKQGFKGAMTAVGHLLVTEGTPLAWRLSGPLSAGPTAATLKGGELRVGGEDGLAFKTDLEARYGDETALTASLAAAQLDIDRMAGIGTDPAHPPSPPQLPSMRRLRELAAAAMPPIPTTLDLTVDNATWGGQPLSDLALHVKPGANGARIVQASGEGPGGLHAALDGSMTDGGQGFAGHVDLGAADLPRALSWIATVAPGSAPSLRVLPFAEAEIAGPVSVDANGLTTSDATLDLDRTRLHGALALTVGDTAPTSIRADLTTAKLDLDAPPDLATSFRELDGTIVALKLTADTVHVAAIGSGAVDAGRTVLDVGFGGGRLALHHLDVADLGGATVSASGDAGPNTATIDARIEAARLESAAALIRKIAPGSWSDALAARAESLAPAHLQLGAAFANSAGGTLAPTRATVEGTMAGTRLAASLSPTAAGTRSETLSIHAETPDGLALMRQLGLPVVASANPIGAARLALSASGDPKGPMDSRASLELDTGRLEVDGRFDLFGKTYGGAGRVALESKDVGPLLRAVGVLPPDPGERVPASLAGALALGGNGAALSDLKGRAAGTIVAGTLKLSPPAGNAPTITGTLDLDAFALDAATALILGPAHPPASGAAWSDEPFAAQAPNLPRVDVSLRTHALALGHGLAAKDASFDLSLAPGFVAVTRGEGRGESGGRIGGRFALRRDGRQATLEGTLTTDGLTLDLPAVKAGVSGTIDVAGSGGTALALVGSLAGTGSATLADLRVPGADPDALASVFKAVEDDTLAVDEEAVTRALGEAAKAPLVAGTRHFALSLAGGTLTLSPTDAKPVAAEGPVASRIGATFDLRGSTLAVNTTETLLDLPKDWSGPPPSLVITEAGPPRSPRRSFAVDGFLNAVAARAIARESARLEAYEFDIRERSLFNTRLQSDRRRETDRLKAEADAKAAADAARRAADLARKAAEAARAEKRRVEEAQPDEAPPTASKPDGAAGADAPRFEAPADGTTSDPGTAGRY